MKQTTTCYLKKTNLIFTGFVLISLLSCMSNLGAQIVHTQIEGGKVIIDNTSDPFVQEYGGRLLEMGALNSSGKRYFNFGFSPPSNWIGANYYDLAGQLRYYYAARDLYTTLTLRNEFNNVIFSIQEDDNVSGPFIHLPQASSRMVIGQWGGYLDNEGYKLVVANGDVRIEGILVADSIAGSFVEVDGDVTNELELPSNPVAGTMVYFNGADWVSIAPGVTGQKLCYCDGVPTWGPCPTAPSCSDGIQNQGETGVDCGGPCPACCPSFLAISDYYIDGIQSGPNIVGLEVTSSFPAGTTYSWIITRQDGSIQPYSASTDNPRSVSASIDNRITEATVTAEYGGCTKTVSKIFDCAIPDLDINGQLLECQ